ncbi:RRM protein [Puccinia graminis f. sp. tritici]|uniref:RRM protein n=1 Tax=Puccinia graminis f. sp. tritici TaxID=56615 RepID=A0A5B0NVN5_PUCGR|nr:RRM protein [Puccinia graminis f. sp. tritici]KAA1093367.1 RRM protein [Puccinia graminis f. sp. tritici]
MPLLSSTASDPLSQFEQFNWSPNLFPEDDDTPPVTKTVGSSALQSLSYAGNEPVALSPIGSQCYSNQSSLSTNSSNDSSGQVGGSAQLRQISLADPRDRRAASGDGIESEKNKSSPEFTDILSHPALPAPAKQQFFRSSPPALRPQRMSSASEINLPTVSAPSGPNPSHIHPPLTRAASLSNQSGTQSLDQPNPPLPRSPTTLWMGDLESWMDEDYVRKCLVMMGWHLPHFVPTSSAGSKADIGPNGVNVKIKMISGASPSSAYCFLTYPTAEMAQHAWRMISNLPPTLMPGCERTFKLNWATGLPGVQPTWDREFSVFIRDLDREVTEGELVALFTCSFPSTKSAKIMGDLSTGLSRGYAFIRFGEESDMHRALALGRSKNGTGLFLRGRCIKITEASGSSGTAGDHSQHRTSISAINGQRARPELPSSVSFGNHPYEQGETRNKALLNSRMVANSMANDPSKSILRIHRDSLTQDVGGLSSSLSTLRLSSSYPPLTNNATQSRLMTNSYAPDHSNANLRINHDGMSQATNRLSSSMSALRLSPGYPPLSAASTGSQTHSLPLPAPSFPRTISACAPLIDRNQSVPALPNHYPASLSRSVCSLAPQGLLANCQSQYTTAPGVAPLPGHPMLSSSAMPVARAAAAAQPNHLISNTHSPALFPALSSSLTHPNSLPSGYMSSTGIFPSPNGVSAANLTQQHQQLHSAYDLPPIDPASSPNSITSHLAALSQIASVAHDASNDPSNTTVFVGGLPACISEGTLKTFFQNFGEITYVKIPPNKGCGFVQYVRREDAQQAMLKMHDFPIHGKSRIRLSWGRSLGDKQVEYVKKLSSALGISFESVWKIVQGQDPSMIKQIASTLGGASGAPPPPIAAPVRPSLPVRRESDQPHSSVSFAGLMPGVPTHSSYTQGLSSGQSTPTSHGPISSPLPSSGIQNSWRGRQPGLSFDRSLNSIGNLDFPTTLPSRRATIQPVTPAYLSFENIPSGQANALRPFDNRWGFPI